MRKDREQSNSSDNRIYTSYAVPKPVGTPYDPNQPSTQPFARKSGHLIPTSRVYKPKSSRGRRGGPRNMTLNNNRRPYQSVPPLDFTQHSLINLYRDRRLAAKRLKYLNKPCPRFTTTGAPSIHRSKNSSRGAGPLIHIDDCSFFGSRCLQPRSYMHVSA